MSKKGSTVYVGNLPVDVREKELDDLFNKYGKLNEIDIKEVSKPPAYAFVEFEDASAADEAVQEEDGQSFGESKLRVEKARGSGGGGGGGGRGKEQGKPGRPRATVSNLPSSCSWQDLKDHFRKQVKGVNYTEVAKEGKRSTGTVEFESEDDLRRAIRKLDKTKFRNPFDETTISVKPSGGGHGRSSSRSKRSPSRSYSRSRSPSRRRSRSRRSGSRSRSRS